jgi:RNA polymerase sigma-70 factor (ECF subfamily)
MPGSVLVMHWMDDGRVNDDAPASEAVQPALFDADSALMWRVREGDEAALAALIDRWKTPLLNFFYRSLGSYTHAEDLAQMTFIRVYRSADHYEPRAKFSTFLFHIARRLLINEYRHRQRKPLDAFDPQDLPAVSDDNSEQEVSEIEEAFTRPWATCPRNTPPRCSCSSSRNSATRKSPS